EFVRVAVGSGHAGDALVLDATRASSMDRVAEYVQEVDDWRKESLGWQHRYLLCLGGGSDCAGIWQARPVMPRAPPLDPATDHERSFMALKIVKLFETLWELERVGSVMARALAQVDAAFGLTRHSSDGVAAIT